MSDIVYEIVLVFVIVAILLIVVHIFLDYKWKLDVLHEIETFSGEVNQRRRNDQTIKLSSISDEVQRFIRDWEMGNDGGSRPYRDEQDDRARKAMDDFFSRYGE